MLIGKAKIELTDIRTGKKKTVEHKNMITNAIGQILSVRVGDVVCNTSNFMPLYSKGLGGLLLFPKSLDENPDNIIAPLDNEPIGYASDDVNTTTNTRRGSRNLTESLEVVGGFQFVWDFASSQGNGTISALSLTHVDGGKNYINSVTTNATGFQYLGRAGYSNLQSNAPSPIHAAVELDFDNSCIYSIYYESSSSSLVVVKSYFPFSKIIGVKNSARGGIILETHSINSSLFTNTQGRFFDGKDGYWYGFATSGNSSGSAVVNWIKISKADYSFTEGTWTLTETYLYSSGTTTISENALGLGAVVYMNGKLYALNYTRDGIYIIDFETPTNIEYVPFGANVFSTKNYLYSYGGYIVSRNVRFNPATKEVTVNSSYSDSGLYYNQPSEIFTVGNIVISILGPSVNAYFRTTYLGTICNLDTPVIKTPAETMKITYTLVDS